MQNLDKGCEMFAKRLVKNDFGNLSEEEQAVERASTEELVVQGIPLQKEMTLQL